MKDKPLHAEASSSEINAQCQLLMNLLFAIIEEMVACCRCSRRQGAEIMNIDPKQYREYRQGKHVPSLSTVCRMIVSARQWMSLNKKQESEKLHKLVGSFLDILLEDPYLCKREESKPTHP